MPKDPGLQMKVIFPPEKGEAKTVIDLWNFQEVDQVTEASDFKMWIGSLQIQSLQNVGVELETVTADKSFAGKFVKHQIVFDRKLTDTEVVEIIKRIESDYIKGDLLKLGAGKFEVEDKRKKLDKERRLSWRPQGDVDVEQSKTILARLTYAETTLKEKPSTKYKQTLRAAVKENLKSKFGTKIDVKFREIEETGGKKSFAMLVSAPTKEDYGVVAQELTMQQVARRAIYELNTAAAVGETAATEAPPPAAPPSGSPPLPPRPQLKRSDSESYRYTTGKGPYKPKV